MTTFESAAVHVDDPLLWLVDADVILATIIWSKDEPNRSEHAGTDPQPLEVAFNAMPQRDHAGGKWTCVVLPGSTAILGTRDLVNVEGATDGVPIRDPFIALANGRDKLPVSSRVDGSIGKSDGDEVAVHLIGRLC